MNLQYESLIKKIKYDVKGYIFSEVRNEKDSVAESVKKIYPTTNVNDTRSKVFKETCDTVWEKIGVMKLDFEDEMDKEFEEKNPIGFDIPFYRNWMG